jgi:hypothetical protein
MICLDANNAQNNIAAVFAQGDTVCVLILLLNFACTRSVAFEVRIDFHWLCGERVKVNSLSRASSKLSAAAWRFRRRLRTKALRFVSTSCLIFAWIISL